MKTKILLITSVLYPALLLFIGTFGFFFVPHDVDVAPSPQEVLFFILTSIGALTVIIFFIVIGIIYWLTSEKTKKHIIIIPFSISSLILFTLLIGFLPKGANA